MPGMVFAYLIETMMKSACESHRTSVTIQCSARRSKWGAKWASFRLVSALEKLRVRSVSASLRVKLPQAIFKLRLAVKFSACKGSDSTVRKTAKFFGLLETRKVGLILRRCFGGWKERTSKLPDSDSDGPISRIDVQRRKLVGPDYAEQEKSKQKVSPGNWCLPFHFASEKKRWATVSRVGLVLLTAMLPSQLGIARAVTSAAFTATAFVVIEFFLNFFGVTNKLSTEIGKLWEDAATFGASVSPQVMRSIVEASSWSKISLQNLWGTAALFIIFFQPSRRLLLLGDQNCPRPQIVIKEP